ncbi:MULTISPECIES: hypothetical protein [unclassified Lysobacter]|uniref:hypothetical protein n=1 Tax=unclassified Lysobacter TaxID=2635362 RepID=UPI000AB1A488|nr:MULTISPECIES: hypothetical protein [unclassified Lysobacter]
MPARIPEDVMNRLMIESVGDVELKDEKLVDQTANLRSPVDTVRCTCMIGADYFG